MSNQMERIPKIKSVRKIWRRSEKEWFIEWTLESGSVYKWWSTCSRQLPKYVKDFMYWADETEFTTMAGNTGYFYTMYKRGCK